jgi:hypothetical protein
VNVQPELHSHPKFLRLKRRIGDIAAEVLLRLWGHCQQNQRGEFWPGADPEYVEVVCGWAGEAGTLFKALTEGINGRPGWIEMEEGGLRIHDWGATNAGLLHNWRVGATSGGRPKTKPQAGRGNTDGNPRDSMANPRGRPMNEGDEGKGGEYAPTDRLAPGVGENKNAGAPRRGTAAPQEAHIPTANEVVAFGTARLTDAIPEGYCRKFHATTSEAHGWVKNGQLIDWEGRIVRYWESDRYTWRADGPGPGRAPGESVEELMAALEQETDPKRRKELRERIKKLEATPLHGTGGQR